MSENRAVVLRTNLRNFEFLYALHDGRGLTKKISKRMLVDLLMDHSLMVGKLMDAGVEVQDEDGGPPVSTRVRRR